MSTENEEELPFRLISLSNYTKWFISVVMAKFIQGQNGCSDSHDQRKPLSTPNKCKDRNMKKAKENYSGENKI